jgi:hypothetical protein
MSQPPLCDAVPFTPPEGFVPDPLFSRRSEPSRHRKQRQRRQAQRRFVPFTDLPRRERRDRTVALGWRIRSDANGAGVFTSHDILPGSREWPESKGGVAHWADVFFLAQGRQPTAYFNATVETVAMVWANRLIELAETAIAAQMTAADEERSRPQAFSKRLPGGHSAMIFGPHTGLASLGGLTVEGAQAAWLRERWDARATLVSMGETARLEPGYRSGIGLTLITAEPNLTVSAVARAIAVYRSRGEGAYTAPPEDFATHQAAIEAIVLHRLWRWDCVQARVAGEPVPDQPEAALLGGGVEINAIRL